MKLFRAVATTAVAFIAMTFPMAALSSAFVHPACNTPASASALSAGVRPSHATLVSALHAAKRPTPPRYDKATQRWEATCTEDGYGPVGSLLRFGPVPFFLRLSDPDKYEQAVLKYQASEKCVRMEAQGNMDAYFENPNDWAIQKLEEKRGSAKRDYANLDEGQVALTLIWAVLITGVLIRIGFVLASGDFSMKGGGVILL
eukprot:CAMPEP_0183293256 /NCGR_PEP_ID=MMETSP0160_2-20130417/2011_1 /TAXON_ID=2839 ORGANISM="Odontella Sinensis, Strain Grunow 1884" /NCGR_SAMPLE_ID=MMETSP0160_2 /ASSEMBLY_ACC=CAM_ASM_000250 /LENGTH=200 /DNA_ID=CAMNT_0025454343 /DNA_START=22 /DNA_END=624 /DNA_ORIENTATION=+